MEPPLELAYLIVAQYEKALPATTGRQQNPVEMVTIPQTDRSERGVANARLDPNDTAANAL